MENRATWTDIHKQIEFHILILQDTYPLRTRAIGLAAHLVLHEQLRLEDQDKVIELAVNEWHLYQQKMYYGHSFPAHLYNKIEHLLINHDAEADEALGRNPR